MSAVIHIIAALERGGAQRVALETAARLHKAERPQWLVTGPPAALSPEATDRIGPRMIELPSLARPLSPTRDFQALLEIRKCIQRVQQSEQGALVVHTHGSKAGVLGRLAARSVEGCRVVHTVHGFGFEAVAPHLRPIVQAAEKAAGLVTDVMVFVSNADRRLARERRFAPSAKVRTIRAGIDPEPFLALRTDASFRDRFRDRWNVPREASLILTVANCKPQKDPLFHIDIVAELAKELPDAHLLFIGGGPLLDEVHKHAERLGVGHRVILPGFLEDPRPAYAAADAYLLASRWEGLPMSVLEALASGLSVVVRDSGWAADLTWAAEIRSLPKSASARMFAAALREILTSPTKRLPQGESVRRSAVLPTEFTLQGMLHQFDQLYRELT